MNSTEGQTDISVDGIKSSIPFPQGSTNFQMTGASSVGELSGSQKAALLLYSLGTDVSVEVMKHMDPSGAKALAQEISNMSLPNSQVMLELLQEFNQRFENQQEALDEKGRREEAERNSTMPFKSLKSLHPEEIASILADEQIQTIALVLSYLNPEQAADVLACFPKNMQADLVERIATIEEIPNELVRNIENIIDEKAQPFFAPESAPADMSRRMEALSIMLQRANLPSDELLSRIGEVNPNMAKELRMKAFTFENIIEVDDNVLRQSLMQVDPEIIALSLKIAEAALIDKLLGCVPPEVREEIKDRRDLMGPKTLMEIEDAQREVLQATKTVMGQ
jgi:flagellar motor switch protein FliG